MAVTANGWPLKDTGLSTFTAPNGHVTSVASHDLAIVFAYAVYRWHTEVEPVTACYGNRTIAEQRRTNPSVMDSNHISATAIDVNGGKHPYELTTHPWYTGFSAAQLTKLRAIVADAGILQLGLDFKSPYRDPMHLQVKESSSHRYSRAVTAASAASAAKRLGDRVAIIQKAVGVTVDRVIGPATITAIKKFQAKHKLVQDAIWGPKTQAAAGGGSTPATTHAFPLAKGHVYAVNDHTAYTHSGVNVKDQPAIKRIQTKLGGLKVDGDFGDATASKVKSFQKAHKIGVDGKVGPATWKAMKL